MQAIHSTLDVLRDRWAPVQHTSTFRNTGQITPEEFTQAGDYLVYKFPSWSWSPAATSTKAVPYLPKDKQYLVTRGVPCHRRLDENFAGGEEQVVQGGEDFDKDGDAEGWLSTGGNVTSASAKVGDVRALGDKGELEAENGGEGQEEEEIPDMEDEEDDEEAIIRNQRQEKSAIPLRTYTLYITYTPYYRTPRLYLSGYTRPTPSSASFPLAPSQMLEDIVGDYKDKTVTLEDFPFFDTPVKTASVHPCKHAAVMKVLLDRADAALKLRREKQWASSEAGKSGHIAGMSGFEGLTDKVKTPSFPTGRNGRADGGSGAEEWEVLQHETEEDETAIRVDQYVVVFLKFMASVTPGIEHDFTMGV